MANRAIPMTAFPRVQGMFIYNNYYYKLYSCVTYTLRCCIIPSAWSINGHGA